MPLHKSIFGGAGENNFLVRMEKMMKNEIRIIIFFLAVLLQGCQTTIRETPGVIDSEVMMGTPRGLSLEKDTARNLVLSWDKVENADSYEVIFSKESGFYPVESKWLVKQNELVLEEDISFAGYFKVRAVNSSILGSWSLSLQTVSEEVSVNGVMEAYLSMSYNSRS